MASSHQNPENAVELFLLPEPYKLNYRGPCNVDIKVLSKLFIIETLDKETSTIEISNILCNISTQNNFALVFLTVDACKIVYDILIKYQEGVKQDVEDSSSNQQQVQDLIFVPLFNEAKSNPSVPEKFKECIIDILQDNVNASECRNSELNEPLRNEFVIDKPSNDSSLFGTLTSLVNQSADECLQNNVVKNERETVDVDSCLQGPREFLIDEGMETVKSLQNDSRKRLKSSEAGANATQNKQCKIEVMDERPHELITVLPLTSQSTLIMQNKRNVPSSHFIVLRIAYIGNVKPELILFISDDKDLCYPYFYETKNARFVCKNCHRKKHFVVAHLRCDNESGEYFLELGLLKHKCAPVKYVRQSGEIIEPCSSFPDLFFKSAPAKNTKSVAPIKSNLISSANNDANERSQASSPDIFNKSTPSPPQTSSSTLISTESNNFEPRSKAMRPPDFQLHLLSQNGIPQYELITFKSPEHQFCYIFYSDFNTFIFVCEKCRILQHTCSAFLVNGCDGEKTVELNKKSQHICEPEEYVKPLEKNEYNFISNRKGNVYLIVYASEDKKLCYTFSLLSKNTYCCDGCKSNSTSTILYVKEKFDGGGYTVAWKNENSIHNCTPKTDDGIEDRILTRGKFKVFNDSGDLKLVTFPFDDENIKCHIYKYSKVMEVFCCINCLEEEDHVVVAQAFRKRNFEEYILVSSPWKHVCQPSNYSNFAFQNPIDQISNELHLKKFVEKIWIEKNLISTNFELQRNDAGFLNAVLLIFTTKEKDFCYRYFYVDRASHYTCHICRISAKLFIDENGKHFVRSSTINHRCEGPIPYQPERTLIRLPDYILLKRPYPIIIIFTSSSHLHCYVYTSKEYTCRNCFNLSKEKTVFARLFKDENDETCVLLNREKHKCEPQIFKNVAKRYNIKL